MQKRTVRQALQYVADYPTPVNDEMLLMPTHELVARALFDIANKPDASIKGSMSRANRARKIIMDRLDGKRRAGTTPHVPVQDRLEMRDLTGGELDND